MAIGIEQPSEKRSALLSPSGDIRRWDMLVTPNAQLRCAGLKTVSDALVRDVETQCPASAPALLRHDSHSAGHQVGSHVREI
jgi:hypothetical protein